MQSFSKLAYILIVSFLIVNSKVVQAAGDELAPDEKYLFLEAVIRHGARTAFSNVIEDKMTKELGVGELTAVGARQQYLLGKLMQQKYHTFINRKFDLNEVWVRSTGFDRTLQSAATLLQGMFGHFPAVPIPFDTADEKMFPQWRNYREEIKPAQIDFDTSLPINFVSYPIWTLGQNVPDLFLKADDMFGIACNATFPLRVAANERVAEYLNDSWYVNYFMENAFHRFGMKEHDFRGMGVFNKSDQLDFTSFGENTFLIADAVQAQYENNPEFDLKKDNEYDQYFLNGAEVLYSLSIFEFYNSTTYNKVVQTPILENIRNNINSKVDIANGKKVESEDKKKLVLLSAHDSTIAQILMNNGYIDTSCLLDYVKYSTDSSSNIEITKPDPSQDKDSEFDYSKVMEKQNNIKTISKNMLQGNQIQKRTTAQPTKIQSPEEHREKIMQTKEHQKHLEWEKKHGGRPWIFKYIPKPLWKNLPQFDDQATEIAKHREWSIIHGDKPWYYRYIPESYWGDIQSSKTTSVPDAPVSTAPVNLRQQHIEWSKQHEGKPWFYQQIPERMWQYVKNDTEKTDANKISDTTSANELFYKALLNAPVPNVPVTNIPVVDDPASVHQQHIEWSRQNGGKPYWFKYIPEHIWKYIHIHPRNVDSTPPSAKDIYMDNLLADPLAGVPVFEHQKYLEWSKHHESKPWWYQMIPESMWKHIKKNTSYTDNNTTSANKPYYEKLFSAQGIGCKLSPKPAANVVFELIQKQLATEKLVYVRVAYDNQYIDFCRLQADKLPYTPKFDCSIARFNEIMDRMTVRDFDKMCYGQKFIKEISQASTGSIVSWTNWTAIGFVGLFIVVAYLLLKYYRNKKSNKPAMLYEIEDAKIHIPHAQQLSKHDKIVYSKETPQENIDLPGYSREVDTQKQD